MKHSEEIAVFPENHAVLPRVPARTQAQEVRICLSGTDQSQAPRSQTRTGHYWSAVHGLRNTPLSTRSDMPGTTREL